MVPVNAHDIVSNRINSIYLEGTNVTFQCDNGSQTLLITICNTNGNWAPNPAELECEPSSSGKITLSQCKIYPIWE